MPYITKERKELIDPSKELAAIAGECATVGELTWALTRLTLDYLGRHYDYARLAECIAALECSKLELYRRVASAYEDGKRRENGEVYFR